MAGGKHVDQEPPNERRAIPGAQDSRALVQEWEEEQQASDGDDGGVR